MVTGILLAAALLQSPARRALPLVDAGIELSHQGRFAEAGQKFVEALSIDPNLAEAHYLLGLVRQQEGRTDRAMQSFRAVLKIEPGHAAGQARVCELEAGAAIGRETGYPAAIAACRRAVQLDPKDPEPHFHLGRTLAKSGDRLSAIRELNTALRLDPKSPGVKFELAMAYVDSQEPGRALPLLQEVVEAQPANGNARFQLASILVRQGDCAAAPPLLEASPESSQKYFLLGGCYKKLNRPEEAAAAYASLEKLRAGTGARMQAKFRSAAAQRLDEAGKVDEAIAEYRAALDLHPDPAMAVDLAVLFLKKGEPAEVLKLLASNETPLARYQTALAHARLGDHEAALSELQAALRAKPDFVEARYQLGVTLLAAGRAAEAAEALAEATRLRPDESAIRLAWAAALEKTGQPARAANERKLAAQYAKSETR